MNTGKLLIFAAVLLPVSVLAGGDSGFKKYAAHEFDQAIEECKGNKDVLSRLVLGFSYLEKYNLLKNKLDRDQSSAYLAPLALEMKLDDTKVLERFLAVPGNQNGNKEAMKILKKAFEGASREPKDLIFMAGFLDPAKGSDVNNIVLDALAARLKTHREYVKKGGTLNEKLRDDVFTSKKIIEPLVKALGDKKNAADARACMVYIEEPVLPFLEKQEVTKEVSDTVVAIRKAMAERIKKYPNSKWYSATGQ